MAIYKSKNSNFDLLLFWFCALVQSVENRKKYNSS